MRQLPVSLNAIVVVVFRTPNPTCCPGCTGDFCSEPINLPEHFEPYVQLSPISNEFAGVFAELASGYWYRLNEPSAKNC